MTTHDRRTVTDKVSRAYSTHPYRIDANILGPVNRPRLYWTSFEFTSAEFTVTDWGNGCLDVEREEQWLPAPEGFLDEGATKGGKKAFPTAVQWIEKEYPPPSLRQLKDVDEASLQRWADLSLHPGGLSLLAFARRRPLRLLLVAPISLSRLASIPNVLFPLPWIPHPSPPAIRESHFL